MVSSKQMTVFIIFELIRQANKSTPKKSLPENALPSLWIITTSASDNLLNFFNAELKLPQWGEGVYFLNQVLKSSIVVADRLPTTAETLWLRILGKGKTQQNKPLMKSWRCPKEMLYAVTYFTLSLNKFRSAKLVKYFTLKFAPRTLA